MRWMVSGLMPALVFWAAIAPLTAAPAENSYILPAGTKLQVELTTTVGTRVNQVGDPFSGEITEPVFANHEEVVPMNSSVDGHITMIKPAGHEVKAEMRLVIDSLTTPDGRTYKLTTGLQGISGADDVKLKGQEGTLQGSGKSRKKAAKEAGILAGVGAGVGAIADGGTGALYGMGIGAAVAVIRHLHRKNKDIVLTQGTNLTFVIPRDTTASKVSENSAAPPQ